MDVDTDNICIMNYWWSGNYGASLTAYALQQLLNGYHTELADFEDKHYLNTVSNCNFAQEFASKYLKVSKPIQLLSDFFSLTRNVFIAGSDQIFRPLGNFDNKRQYYLDFVLPDAKKIAFSASFATDKQQFLREASNFQQECIKRSLKSFDCISVREKSGIEICKDLFDVEAEWIIDPVFILEKTEYDKLIKSSSMNFKDKIVSYILDKNRKYKKAYKYLKNIYNIDVIETADTGISVEDWLSSIKNCKFMITDSFHGLCFAIIFNKPFICVLNKTRGAARFESILEMLGIENQCISSIDEIYQKDCIFKINYEKVNQNIEKEQEKGLNFLNKALNTPSGKEKEKTECRMKYLENLVSDLEKQATLKYQIKKSLWELWLFIFYKFLPEPIKNLIRFIRDLGKCK